MKHLYVNGELVGSTDKIIVTDTDIVGQGSNSFALKRFNFSDNTYEIKDDKGNIIEPDIDELTELKRQNKNLEQSLADTNAMMLELMESILV